MSDRKLLSRLVIDTGAGVAIASASGYMPFEFEAARAFVHVRIDATAATLQGTLAFFAGGDPQDDSSPPGLLFSQVTLIAPATTPAGVTLSGSGASVITLNNPGIGATKALYLILNPPPVIIPVFTYTSGGGTARVRVKVSF